MQAAEAETAGFEGGLNQRRVAVAAEADLACKASAQGPVEQGVAISSQGPVEMLRTVDSMHREVVEMGTVEAPEHRLQLALPLLEAQTRQKFAGDHPVAFRHGSAPLHGLSQEAFSRSISRSGLQVIDSGADRCFQHGLHLFDGAQSPHCSESEQADGATVPEAPSHSSEGSSCSPRFLRWRTRAAGLRSSTNRLKAL